MERSGEREMILPTGMLWRKLTIDPWSEAILKD
jgi:hypothetical protein